MDSLVLKDYASWTKLRELGGKKVPHGAEKIVDPVAARYTENRNHYIMVSHFHEQLKKYGPPGAGTVEGFDRIMNSFKNEHWKLWEEWRAEPAETRLLKWTIALYTKTNASMRNPTILRRRTHALNGGRTMSSCVTR